MYPPERNEPELAVRNAIASLIRAGLEATDLLQDPATGSWVVRLSSMPPKNGLVPMRSYLRRYLRACGYKPEVKVAKCRVWISLKPRDKNTGGTDERQEQGSEQQGVRYDCPDYRSETGVDEPNAERYEAT